MATPHLNRGIVQCSVPQAALKLHRGDDAVCKGLQKADRQCSEVTLPASWLRHQVAYNSQGDGRVRSTTKCNLCQGSNSGMFAMFDQHLPHA
eukprot:9622622-Alexandrium_andersonii.AAC.1